MKRPMIAMVLALALPAAAQAADYTYVEFGYTKTDTTLTDLYGGFAGVDGYDGATLRGSWGFADNWYATLSYGQGNGDFGLDMDSDWALGLGYHYALTDSTDFIVQLQYGETREDIGPNLTSKNTTLEFGVNGGAGNFYGQATIGAEDLNSNISVLDETQAIIRVSGGYKFSDTWSLRAEVKYGFEGASTAFIGPRWTF